MKSSIGFKNVLNSMEKEVLVNLIWSYTDYVDLVLHEMKNDYSWDISPLNIEDYYKEVYIKNIK